VDLDWEDPAPLVQGTGHGAVLVAIRTVLADGHARSAADICREGIPRGDEAYHVELVLDASTGTLQAFVLDGELENFIRSPVPSIEIVADVGGAPRTLVLAAVPNPATGETVGDTSLFQAQAEWLKTTRGFDAVLKSITVRGTTFAGVKFNFPKGNDTD